MFWKEGRELRRGGVGGKEAERERKGRGLGEEKGQSTSELSLEKEKECERARVFPLRRNASATTRSEACV